jgi:hypothetical protein
LEGSAGEPGWLKALNQNEKALRRLVREEGHGSGSGQILEAAPVTFLSVQAALSVQVAPSEHPSDGSRNLRPGKMQRMGSKPVCFTLMFSEGSSNTDRREG